MNKCLDCGIEIEIYQIRCDDCHDKYLTKILKEKENKPND